jgi:hypothetical protein
MHKVNPLIQFRLHGLSDVLLRCGEQGPLRREGPHRGNTMSHPPKLPAAGGPRRSQPVCRLANEDCSGPLQRDHVGYSSVTQQDVFQWFCRYHNCTEARELRFFVANRVLGGRPLTGKVRIKLNEWHVRHRLHPRLKRRIHRLSEQHPLPQEFVPGQGQKLADRAVAEGRAIKFRWKPDLCEGKILGFWIAFEGQVSDFSGSETVDRGFLSYSFCPGSPFNPR